MSDVLRLILLASAVFLMACVVDDLPDEGLLGLGPGWPYPSAHLEISDARTATGVHIDMSLAGLPTSTLGQETPIDTQRLARLDGFPSLGTIVIRLPDQSIGAAGLAQDPAASVADSASIRLLDLNTGERLPYKAELDAFPDIPDQQRVLLVRPLAPYPAGGHVGVALTTDLMNAEGTALDAPAGFAALRDKNRQQIPGYLLAWQEHYEGVLLGFEADGLDRSSLLLAWDFHVASSAVTLAPFDRLLELKREGFAADPAFDPGFVVDEFRDADLGDPMPAGAWRMAQGTMQLPAFVSPDRQASFDADGLPALGAVEDVLVQVLVPDSVRSKAAGSVGVLVFGHGILSTPGAYLDDFDDASAVVELVDRLGMVAIGTEWRGLTQRDLLDAVEVALDFGRFSELTDHMLDGVTNALLMERLPATAFAQQPVFAAADGGGSLLDPETIRYYGISLGGIEGTVFMGNAERTPYGVLHVPGASWSTMLERSSNWASFEVLLVQGIENPMMRQLAYAATQHFWDPVDPAVHAADGRLQGKSALWQMSVGDEQVPNFTTEILARSLAVPLVGPAVYEVWGLQSQAAPLGPDAAGLFQMDPVIGRPDDVNRPAAVTGAHGAPRKTQEHIQQVEAFFAPGAEGTIIAPCAPFPCIFD